MSKEAFDLVNQAADDRRDATFQSRIDRMADVYEGRLPAEFDKFFPNNTPKQQIGMIRGAWDDLATQIGRIPEFRQDTLSNSDAELKRVGVLEKIAHSYLRDANPSAASFSWEYAWWLVGAGRAVAMVKPDFDTKKPIMVIRDPRTAYPRAKKVSGNTVVELADIIFKYEIKSTTARAMGLKPAQVENRRTRKMEDKDKTIIVEFVDEQNWVLMSEGGSVQNWEHKLGVVPGWVSQTFGPNSSTGLGLFDDQVALQVSISRLLSQKMAFADRLVNPPMWVKGHEDDITIGPNVIMRLSAQGEIGQLSPPTHLQVDQDIAMLERFSRIMNRNPESRTGEVQSRGTYTSAKTLEQLSEAIDTVIGRYWDIMGHGISKLVEIAYRMDETLWPNEKKSMSGNVGGKRFQDEYIPSKDIAGRYFVRADYGFGIGGYQGFLMHLQANQGGTMSKRRAMEAMPGVSDVDEEMRTIELEQMDEAGNAAFQQQSLTGGLDLVLWAKMRKKMAAERIPLHEVVLDYTVELQEQAAAVQQQPDAGVGALTAPPAPGGEAEPQSQPPGVPAGVVG